MSFRNFALTSHLTNNGTVSFSLTTVIVSSTTFDPKEIITVIRPIFVNVSCVAPRTSVSNGARNIFLSTPICFKNDESAIERSAP